MVDKVIRNAPFVLDYRVDVNGQFRRFCTTLRADVTFASGENPETEQLETWLDVYEADGPQASEQIYEYLCKAVEGRVTLFKPDSTIVKLERN